MSQEALTEIDAPDVAPLAHTQRNLWFIQQLAPDSPVYNMSRAWRVSGDLNLPLFRRAVASLVERHKPLRARVRQVEGDAVQWAPEAIPDVLEYEDWRTQTVAGEDQAIAARIVQETRKIIDLENGPVFRAILLHLRDREFIFFMVMHHAFSDGWSISVLARDLSGFYNALISERDPDLPVLQTSYFEFARAQMSGSDSALRSDLDYWQQALTGAPPLLDLPTDFSRPVMQKFRGRRLGFEVGADTLQALKTLAREHRATLFMVLISAFKLLLYRFSGQTDISVGTPFANRSASALENLVGLFVNTLVIRSRIGVGSTFGDLLLGVRGRLLEAFRHSSTPFEQILEHLKVPRDPGYNPLFQVMFVLQNTPQCALEMASLTTRDFTAAEGDERARGIGVAKFDLSLTITERDGALKCALDYNTDLFFEETVESLGRSFVRLLNAVCTMPGQSLDRLPMLDRDQRRHILFEWNRTDEALSADTTVQECFSRQAERTPDEIAVIDSSGSVSYRDLDRWSLSVAAALREHGLRPGDVVAIVAAPSADWVAALLGVLRIGSIVLPLEPALPTPRLRTYVKNGGARVVLTPTQFSSLALDLDAEVLEIPGISENIDIPRLGGGPPAELTDIAYIMFTSGSTGSPRAVAGTHRGILNRCAWMSKEHPYAEGEACCHHISPAFVDVFAEVFGPLLAGATLSVIGQRARSDPTELISELGRRGIARITLTPTMLRSMLETRGGVRRLKCLVLWISSGEPLDRELCGRIFGQLPDATLLNIYGSTEVAADATWFDCSRAPVAGRIPAGRPIANVKTYILDPQMQPLPPGFRGELHIGGAGVAHGYWQQKRATEIRFVANPFDAGLGRIYKTGDLARYRKDGSIEVLGRVDGQVKLHGIRVGVEEVESRLELHKDVRCAVVGLWKDAPGREFLVAWCVPAPGCVITARRLRHYLGHGLPRQWVPSHYVSINALPQLASGKTDRQSLPAPRAEAISAACGARLPKSDVERELHSIWTELLQCKIEDLNEDFFDLGGHSLLVFQLLDRIESAFGVRLQVSTVFLAPTIVELATRIRQLSTADHTGVLIKIRDRGGTPLVCVPAAATTVLSLTALASRFGDDQSLYGIESYGLIAGTEAQDNIEEMAQTYVDALRHDQPHGPYCLAGKCFGGVVAFEMARKLSEAGERVAFLALLETGVPLRNLDRVLIALAPPERQKLEALFARDRGRMRWTQADIEAEFERNLSSAPAGIQRMMREVYSAHRMALGAYVPTPVDVPITVFRSRAGRWSERVGWDLFTRSDSHCREFDGDRDSLFEAPSVHELSHALSVAMKRALAR